MEGLCRWAYVGYIGWRIRESNPPLHPHDRVLNQLSHSLKMKHRGVNWLFLQDIDLTPWPLTKTVGSWGICSFHIELPSAALVWPCFTASNISQFAHSRLMEGSRGWGQPSLPFPEFTFQRNSMDKLEKRTKPCLQLPIIFYGKARKFAWSF